MTIITSTLTLAICWWLLIPGGCLTSMDWTVSTNMMGRFWAHFHLICLPLEPLLTTGKLPISCRQVATKFSISCRHRECSTEGKTYSYSKDRLFTFRGERAWHPPDNATPSNFLVPKSLDQELSADVSFVSVLAMVLSEY